MNDTEKQITVKAVTAVKKNKKGHEFVSVMDNTDVWWYVDDKRLFTAFKKGVSVNCRINRDNDFARIVDVMDSDYMAQPEFKKGQADEVQMTRIEDKLDEINNKLDNIKSDLGTLLL